MSTAQAFLNSKELANGRGNKGWGGEAGLVGDSLPAPAVAHGHSSTEPPLPPQPPTAACLRLHSTASSWDRQPPSRVAPSTSAATQATVWWDTAWPSVPGTPKATTYGVSPFLSVKVSSGTEVAQLQVTSGWSQEQSRPRVSLPGFGDRPFLQRTFTEGLYISSSGDDG